jgi:hypothetical protein
VFDESVFLWKWQSSFVMEMAKQHGTIQLYLAADLMCVVVNNSRDQLEFFVV